MTQPKLAHSQQTSCKHRVENGARDELVMLAEQAEVVVRPVHNQLMRCKGLERRGEIQTSQWIQEPLAEESANLDETHFFGISMQAVRLGIDRDPARLSQGRK